MTFESVKTLGLALPDVEAATKYDGSPVLKRGGAFMAGLATHASAEADTLVVRVDLVLVRLSRIDPEALRDVLAMSWRLTGVKARKRPG